MEPEELTAAAATIIVIGDIGQSPRICNHAYSFASHGIYVNLIGYLNSMPHQRICTHENIKIHPLAQPPKFLSSHNFYWRILMLPLKFIWIFTVLLFSLFTTCATQSLVKKNFLLLQNPPGIPTMLACLLIARLKNMIYIVDWHNYSYSMFGGWVSKLLQYFEGFMGSFVDMNICVSQAMQYDLKRRWNLNATILYDRPPSWIFKKQELNEKQLFLRKFLSMGFNSQWESDSIIDRTQKEGLFINQMPSGIVQMNEKRPIFLVSSTSWTPDEDFSLLLNGLHYYDNLATGGDRPKIFVVITGKGPEKEKYMEKIRNMSWNYVLIITAWLEAEDYPKLLSCADIGVSLHTSTSGLDLPMKIVDMFGSMLPVISKRFPAIDELVKDEVNGILFNSAHDLGQVLIRISENFPQNELLKKLQWNCANQNSQRGKKTGIKICGL